MERGAVVVAEGVLCAAGVVYDTRVEVDYRVAVVVIVIMG